MSHAEQISALGGAGCHFVQIREKEASSDKFYSAAREAVRAAHEFEMKVIINDRVDIAIAIKADGVHLGQDDLSADEARRLLGRDAIIGLSTHSIEQALLAADFPVDYIAIGPIFATNTKENPDPVVGLEGLTRVRKALGKRVLVAIGGINSGNVASVISAGADSVAVISVLYKEPVDIAARYKELGQIINNGQQS